MTTSHIDPGSPLDTGFDHRFRSALARHVSGPVTDDAELLRLGLDSLALVRIVVEVAGDDPDRDLDLGDVLGLRTVAELRRSLAGGTGAGR